MTKKEIVKQISDKVDLTQLKTKEIVQLTFDAIVETLLEEKRIELRNFGVFEVKRRKRRKARNPRTGQKVDVPPKNVVTFKPGKEMEERVRQLTDVPELEDDETTETAETAETAEAAHASGSAESNGVVAPATVDETPTQDETNKPKRKPRKKAPQT